MNRQPPEKCQSQTTSIEILYAVGWGNNNRHIRLFLGVWRLAGRKKKPELSVAAGMIS
jgi:hypothetical protein